MMTPLRYVISCILQGKVDQKLKHYHHVTLHSGKSNNQVYFWRKCLLSYPEILSTNGFGWHEDDSEISIQWNTVIPAPDEVLELMFYTCPRKCVAGNCPCLGSSLPCTDSCTIQNCDNYHFDDIDDEERDEDDIDD